MKSLLLALVVFTSGQFAQAEPRPGILLRVQGTLVDNNNNNVRTLKMPEVRIISNGSVVAGMVDANGIGNLKRIDSLSQGEILELKAKVEEASHGEIKRWISGAFCLRAPDFQEVYTANNGSVFLRDGDICLSGGRENTSSAARELVALLSGYVQQIER